MRGVHNWSYYDVVKFLKEHGFRLNHTEGSHYFYIGRFAGQNRQVTVPFHSAQALKPRTLKGIIKQSGIPQKDWLNW